MRAARGVFRGGDPVSKSREASHPASVEAEISVCHALRFVDSNQHFHCRFDIISGVLVARRNAVCR